MNEHIPDRELLRAADGELSRRRRGQVNAHLAACWPCRTRMRDLEGAIDEFVHIHTDEFKPLIPTIESPRALLRARIAGLEEAENKTWRERLWSSARLGISPIYATAAVALVAIAVLLFLTAQRNIPAVQASEVLSKAQAGEHSQLQQVKQPVVYQKVQIKIGERRFSRTIYRDTTSARHVDHIESAAAALDRDAARTLAPLEQVFSEAKLDWQAPLSPSRFSNWRSALQVRTEQIRREPNFTEIQTTTSEGPVAEARITLRNSDFHPILESLRLRDNSVVEIAELDYQVFELNQLRSDLFDVAPRPVIGAGIRKPAATGAMLADALRLELDVVKRLDQADAFLGEQIVVERNRGAVVVEGVVDDGRRKSAILQALGPVLHNPGLRFEVVVPGEGRNQAAAADGQVSVQGIETLQHAPADSSLRAYLAQKSGNGGDAEEDVQLFTNEVSLHSQSARAHALALKQIAERFSPDDLNRMTPDQHRQWRAMLNGHAHAMLVETRAIQEKLEPIFRSNPEEKRALMPTLNSDADLIDASARLSDLAAANDNAVWRSFAASTQVSPVTLVCLPEFWESLLDAEILAQEISANTKNGD